MARLDGERLRLEGFIGMPDGTRIVRGEAEGRAEEAEALGVALGQRLLAQGGRQILDTLERRSA
jgi:hydroxymethylbilane synthase